MKRSPRELEHEVDKLKRGDSDLPAGDDAPAVTVGWREADPEERPDGMAFDPGSDDGEEPATLTYDLWAAQRDTGDVLGRDDPPDVVAFLAGYGAGKSLFGARWLLAQAIEHPGSRFLAMGVDFQKARDTTYPKLFAALPGDRTTLTASSYNGPEESPLVADYNRQDHRLTLTNDSVITLGSADKYSRYAGAEFGAAWLDEPSHYGEELHDLTGMVTTRLRGVDGPKTQLWTLTGEGYNAAWEILEQRQDADGEPIGLDIEVVRASVLENPYLAAGDKERFKRKYEGTPREEQALYGGFVAATGLVYSSFSRETHVISHGEARSRVDDGDEWRVYGYDAGWKDPRVVLEVGKTPYDQLVLLDEYVERGTHVEDAIEWLEANGKPRGTIFCEHEPADIETFEQAEWPARKAEKSLDAGISEVRRRLGSDGNAPVDEVSDGGGAFIVTRGGPGGVGENRSGGSVRRGTPTEVSRQRVADGGSDGEQSDASDDRDPRVGLLVSDRCQQTIREFLGYKEEYVGKSQAIDHCLDSLRYLCMGVASSDYGAGSRSQPDDIGWGA